MKSEKLRLYTIELTLVIFLLLAMIFNNIFTRPIIAIILLVYMLISIKLIKTDKKDPLAKSGQIIILLSAFGIIYIAVLYIIGIFAGFYNATVRLSMWSIGNYIIPYTVIIISSELIRKTILLKEDKKSRIIILIATVMLDVILYSNIYNLSTTKDYFSLITFIIFSSIANNFLYNYIIINFRSMESIIVYRLITILYIYIIPITPNIDMLFDSVIRIIVPYIIYIILQSLYKGNKHLITTKRKMMETILSTLLCMFVALVIMLVSCKFKWGVLVIGSGSMTGTINKGDIVIYERYEEQDEIKTGDIIVFKSEDKQIIHRVVDQKALEDEVRYYTKGDANMQEDEGYRKREDIVGKVKGRIPVIGRFTLWLNDII